MSGVFTCCCPDVSGSGLDVEDLTKAEVAMAKMTYLWVQEMRQHIPGFENCHLRDCPDIGVRETRHFRGEYVLDIHDILTQRQYEDTIGRGSHPIDVSPIPQELKDVKIGNHWHFNIPYRSLVPCEIDNLLLAGRCISCTHEASGCVRPSVQCMVTGQAAGTAAAMCAAKTIPPRELNTDQLRQKLTEQNVVL